MTSIVAGFFPALNPRPQERLSAALLSAETQVAAVRDDPAARLAMLGQLFHGPTGNAPRHAPFRRAARSFMRYPAHRDLAEAESAAERFFMNVALTRVLYAHALVAALASRWAARSARPPRRPAARNDRRLPLPAESKGHRTCKAP
jgi:hypothetical protein